MQVGKLLRAILRRVLKKSKQSDWASRQILRMAKLGGRLVL